ncbi:putative diguanylate cyclase YcdT [Caloramator mitchellensis]|uniref:Putative diguanylate cyclase YcdT n=1 Tax=Caloramator mitchellensis TaxID=908809 RepID=A0A0R3JYZ0_CALMK|nr:sensor domain-containing diguanylate cyclase [Caloramator mitchellensis]KRQ86188.1 putative diguanylate cyclase YcdT [Caloramator mitchellensis]
MNKRHAVFRLATLLASLYILSMAFNESFLYHQSTALMIITLFVATIIMGLKQIAADRNKVELTDAVFAFVFFIWGWQYAVIFTFVYWIVIDLLRARQGYELIDINKALFHASIFSIASYLASNACLYFILNFKVGYLLRYYIMSGIFVGLYLLVNIAFVKIDYYFIDGEKFNFSTEIKKYLWINFIVSALISSILWLIYFVSGYTGTILVLFILVIIHYFMNVYSELIRKTELMNSLIKITRDIVIYGDFSDKINRLVDNLKNLIPYDICAIYFFQSQDEETQLPIAYRAPSELDISELEFNLSSSAVTAKTVREGKIYISKDVAKDSRIKITGKLSNYAKSIVFVPIIIDNSVNGLIAVAGGTKFSQFLSQGVIDCLSILSNQLALAFENNLIYKDIKFRAEVDALTGLYNRNMFDNQINQLTSSNVPFSFILFDLDDFKQINDIHGHIVGDKALKLASDIILKSIRKTDMAFRYGGEEIAIILKELSEEDALIIAERIRKKIEKAEIKDLNNYIRITISGGVVSFPGKFKSIEDLIRRADAILYSECKNKGKNRVCASINM